METVLYLGIVFATVLQSASNKWFNKTGGSAVPFNALKALSAFVLLGAVSVPRIVLHGPTALYGGVYGAALCLSMYCGYRAMCLGPMALTSMIASLSVAIPVLWGVFVRGEPFHILKAAAFICLVAAMVLTNIRRGGGQNVFVNRRAWAIFLALTYLCNGVCSVLQKEHQSRWPGQYTGEFMLTAMLLCSLLFLTAALVKLPLREFLRMKGKRYGVLAGVCNGLANFWTLTLAGAELASVLFPVISAGTIFGSMLCGRLVFREKLGTAQVFALVFGIAAVILLKL